MLKYVYIICFIIVLDFITGMWKEPWWFRFVYNFPIILLLCKIEKDYGKDNKRDGTRPSYFGS